MENQNNINMPEDQPKAKRTFEGTRANLPNKKGKKVFKIIASLALAAGLITLVYFGLNWYQGRGLWANIDGTKIQLSFYNKILNAYKSQDKTQLESTKTEVPKKYYEDITSNQILLHTALAKEANKKNIAFGQNELDKFLEPEFTQLNGKDNFYAYYQKNYGWDKDVTDYIKTTDMLQSKLRDVIYENKNFSGVSIRWDLTKTGGVSDKSAYEKEIIEKMNSEVLPLYKQNKSTEEIQKTTDSYKVDNGLEDRFALYTSVIHPTMYQFYNGLTDKASYSKTFSDYQGEGDTNYSKMSNLKNVGDYTEVFKSSTGYYVVFRLESIKAGDYASEEQLLQKYNAKTKYYTVNKYNPEQINKQINDAKKSLSNSNNVINKVLNIQTAQAADCLAGIHRVAYDVSFVNADNINENVWGTTIGATGERDRGFCGDRNFSFESNPPGYWSGSWSTTKSPNTYQKKDWVFYNLTQKFTFGKGSVVIDCLGYGYVWYVKDIPAGWEYSSGEFSDDGGATWQSKDLRYTRLDFSKGDNGSLFKYQIRIRLKKKIIPTYDGTIQTNKRLADGTLVPWNGGAANPPFSSYVELINPNGGVFGGSNSNPSTTTPVWVKWDNHQSNEEGRWVSDRVAVPYGWRIKGVATSLGGQPLANDGLSCTGPNNTGSCTVKGITVRNGTATFVDWFYEKIPPTLELTCTSDTPTTAGQINIKASTNIPGDPTTATVLYDYDKNPPTTPRTLITGSDSFELKDYRDDAQHTFNVSYQGLTKSITFGPNSPPAQCKIQAWYYPWLQTKNGDVVANGKIIGQQSGDKRLGSRLPTQKEKEAEYLIIASFSPYAESGSNFCSTYNYILTNPNATKGRCTNGFGYTLNNNALGKDNDDNVTKGVAQAYDAFPALCKSNNPSDLAAISVSLSDCPDGKIYRINGGDLPAINVKQGRATILVDGDVNINKTISYATNVGGGNPKDQPNLAIVVKGNANINNSLKKIDSLIYATGTISTCSAANSKDCKSQLIVKGSLIAKNGFSFKRTYFDKPSRAAAEFVDLNPVSILYPPPGISTEYFVGYNNGASIDSGEFQPRF